MIITAYKGFEKDLSCRGFRYELGKDYTIDETPKLCRVGFHACMFPLDVLDYYPYGVYAKVIFNDHLKVDGLKAQTGLTTKDSKICGSSIHICESLVDVETLFIESLTYIYKLNLKYGDFPSASLRLVKSSGTIRALFDEVKVGKPVALWHMLSFKNVYNAIYDDWNHYTKNNPKEEMIDLYKAMGAIQSTQNHMGNRVKNILVDEEN